MKKFYFMLLILISAFAISCSKSSSNVRVDIKIKNNTEKQHIFLELVELDGSVPMILDSSTVEKGNSEVTLKGGKVDAEALYRIILDDNTRFFLLVPDLSNITVEFDLEKLEIKSTNSPAGNELKSLLTGFNSNLETLNAMRDKIQAAPETMDSSRVVMEKDFMDQLNKTGSYVLNIAKSAKSPAVSLYALSLVGNIVSIDQVMPVLEQLKTKYPESKRIKKIDELISGAANGNPTQDLIGKEAPEINLPDINGKLFSLKSLRGKYVLIDFWASWCRPCRLENPNVVKAFNKFSSKNFTILGVSLDREKADWIKAINDDGLYWHQVSDLKFWDAEVVSTYKFEGIPFNVLVDPQGVIVAKDLRGEELIKTLEKFFK
jgi:peroxiredoxin